MQVGRCTQVFAIVGLLGLFGCSSSEDNGAPTSGIPATFSKYCSGTLLVEKELQTASGAGSWSGNGSLKAAAGTSMLVSIDFGTWGGFVMMADGSPAQVDADFKTGLIKGTDFTADCATDPSTAEKAFVLLRDSTFFDNSTLTGQGCVVLAGTEFLSYSFSGGMGGVATFSAPDLKTKCGFELGYTKDMIYGSLVVK